MLDAFSSRLPLSRTSLDRDYLSRARPELFDELWADAATRVLVLHRDRALVDGTALRLLAPAETPTSDLRLYLGRDDDARYVAVAVDDAAAEALGSEWGSLRDLGAELPALDAGLFVEALGLANWHASHEFSPRSGERTEPVMGGWVRRAPGDTHDMFPRTDAAIIVGITDADDRILLGSNAMWAGNRYSVLAGFVEPGESLEHAVVREVFEESGIRVIDPVYLGSQPWPFPASLMVGFRATVDPAHPVELQPDGEEIMDLRWFSRDELTAALPDIMLPGYTSIARAIIEDWFGGPIEDHVEW